MFSKSEYVFRLEGGYTVWFKWLAVSFFRIQGVQGSQVQGCLSNRFRMLWGTGIQVSGLVFRVESHRSLMGIYFTVSALSSPGRYEEIFVT